MHLIQTTSTNPDFQLLASRLEADLKARDGEDAEKNAALNQIDKLTHVVIAYDDKGTPIATGAFRAYDDTTVEIKRMYVDPQKRKRGLAQQILKALEAWAQQEGYTKAVLETGRNQPEAIALYEKAKYQQTERFGRYKDSPNSVCFAKIL